MAQSPTYRIQLSESRHDLILVLLAPRNAIGSDVTGETGLRTMKKASLTRLESGRVLSFFTTPSQNLPLVAKEKGRKRLAF